MRHSLRATVIEMRTCRRVAKRLQHYLDGELDAGAALTVERHLEACLKCGLEVATYANVKAVLARYARDVANADSATLDRLHRFAETVINPDDPRREAH